jgi:hypothetical protein
VVCAVAEARASPPSTPPRRRLWWCRLHDRFAVQRDRGVRRLNSARVRSHPKGLSGKGSNPELRDRGWTFVRALFQQTLGQQLPVGISEWSADANPSGASNLAYTEPNMSNFVTASLNAMVEVKLDFAAEFDAQSVAAYGGARQVRLDQHAASLLQRIRCRDRWLQVKEAAPTRFRAGRLARGVVGASLARGPRIRTDRKICGDSSRCSYAVAPGTNTGTGRQTRNQAEERQRRELCPRALPRCRARHLVAEWERPSSGPLCTSTSGASRQGTPQSPEPL